jgi:hypothetical protein
MSIDGKASAGNKLRSERTHDPEHNSFIATP